MTTYWDCGEMPVNLTEFIDMQVGEALKTYMEDLSLFIDQNDGEIVFTAFMIDDEEGKPIEKKFALSDLIRIQCIDTLSDGTMHPHDLETRIIGVSAVLKKLAGKLDAAADDIQQANSKTTREWK